jgi:hypothetical protein
MVEGRMTSTSLARLLNDPNLTLAISGFTAGMEASNLSKFPSGDDIK